MSLAAEALLSVTGIFHDAPIGPADGRRAAAVPKDWRAIVEAWLDERKPAAFKPPPKIDHGKVWDTLSAGVDRDKLATVTSALVDDTITADYTAALSNALEYLKERWPVLQLDAMPAPIILPPGRVELGRAATLLAAVDDPSTILADMRSGALTYPQGDAFRAVYPALSEMLRALIWQGMTERKGRADSYTLGWRRERIVRVLIGQPPGLDLNRVEPPKANAAKPAPIKIDFSQERTKAQALEANDSAA